MLAEQVAEFYPDLMDERFESAFAIYHQRYSTNTFPQWWLAQPFRMLAHNGEINTLKGNLNWMKATRFAWPLSRLVTWLRTSNRSSHRVHQILLRWMLCLRCWCVRAVNAPMAKTMLVPESWSKQAIELPQAWRDMYSYCNSVMEPWDGPAALAMTDGRWVCAGLGPQRSTPDAVCRDR